MAKKHAAKENVCKKAANGVTDSFNVSERVTKLSDGYCLGSGGPYNMDIFCNGPVEGGVAVVINFFVN